MEDKEEKLEDMILDKEKTLNGIQALEIIYENVSSKAKLVKLNFKIEIGSTVKVNDIGKIYTTYSKIFEKLEFKNMKYNPINKKLVKGKKNKWTVFGIDNKMLALNNDYNDNQILIDTVGISPTSETKNIIDEKCRTLLKQINEEYKNLIRINKKILKKYL